MIDRQEVKRLVLEGARPSEIARRVGCTTPTIWRIRKELKENGELPEDDVTPTSNPGQFGSGTDPHQPRTTAPRIPAGILVDEEVQRRQREIALLELDTRRIEAEERMKRAQRSYDGGAAPGGGSDLAVLRMELMARLDRLERERQGPASQVASFVPLIQTFLQSLMGLLGQLVAKSSEKPDFDLGALQAIVGQQPADSLSTVVPLVKQVLELANELGGGGEQSELAQIMAAVAPMLAAGKAPAMLPQQAGQPQPQPQQPQDPMKLRIASFLLAIEREARAGSDPWTVADMLERDLMICPQEFRNLVLENSTSAILHGLGRFVPAPIHQRITGLMSQNQQARAWLDQFVQALQSDGSEGEDGYEDEAPAEAPPNGAPVFPPADLFGTGAKQHEPAAPDTGGRAASSGA